jgi:hypothetical protein
VCSGKEKKSLPLPRIDYLRKRIVMKNKRFCIHIDHLHSLIATLECFPLEELT